jgi:hypothetical protein
MGVAEERSIMKSMQYSNCLPPHQTTMLSDTLNLFVSWVTDGLTERSQTRGLGWLETSLTRKESGWGATMEVERGWGHSGRSSLATSTLCWTCTYMNASSENSYQDSFTAERNPSLSLHHFHIPFISCLHFLLFLPFSHLSRLSPQSWLLLSYSLLVLTFTLRFQTDFSAYFIR